MNKSCLLGVVLLLASTQGHAIPTLFFDGTTDYDAASGLLNINSVLTGSVDIAPPPDLTGSSLSLQASFVSSNTTTVATTGIFGTAPGTPDLSIVDGGAITLLEGEILDLVMSGDNGLVFGELTGNFSPQAGSLLADFSDPSGIFALVLNIDTTFSADMFDSDFSGEADGQIRYGQVPIPTAVWLFISGLLGLAGLARRKKVA